MTSNITEGHYGFDHVTLHMKEGLPHLNDMCTSVRRPDPVLTARDEIKIKHLSVFPRVGP